MRRLIEELLAIRNECKDVETYDKLTDLIDKLEERYG